jgi:hypothetical protein
MHGNRAELVSEFAVLGYNLATPVDQFHFRALLEPLDGAGAGR